MEIGKLKAGKIEKADAMRALSCFPPEWGFPPGRPDSEERARWVKERVHEHITLQRSRRRAAAEAIKFENFQRQRYLLLTRDRW
jgi:hypothetical protein